MLSSMSIIPPGQVFRPIQYPAAGVGVRGTHRRHAVVHALELELLDQYRRLVLSRCFGDIVKMVLLVIRITVVCPCVACGLGSLEDM